MYQHHFRLHTRPFAETVDPSAYVPVPGRDAILHRLRYGLEAGPGAVAAFGATGVGKTALVRRMARDLGWPVIAVSFTAMPAGELIGLIADGFVGAREPGATLARSVERIREALVGSALRGERPLLIVDEAHLIADEATFEALRLLLNLGARGMPDLGLVLVGNAELMSRVPEALADRIAAKCLVAPFTASETSAYVLGRLERAGALMPLFDAEALRILHRESDGLPRRLNRLADLALLIAFAREQAAPDAEAVRVAAAEAAFDRAA